MSDYRRDILAKWLNPLSRKLLFIISFSAGTVVFILACGGSSSLSTAVQTPAKTLTVQRVSATREPTKEPTKPPRNSAVNSGANLRSGPGTNYAIVGGKKAGDVVQVVATNSERDWYQLDSGVWIAAFLVDDAPGGLSVVQAPAPPTSTPAPVAPTNTPVIVQQPQQPVQSVEQPQPVQNCDPSYPTVCIAPYPPDLNCPHIPYRRFQVVGADPHNFDGDNDGVGCESG